MAGGYAQVFFTERHAVMADVEEAHTWPELAEALYDKLTGQEAEITYDFDDLELYVPSTVGEDAEYAHWRLNGTLKIRTKEADS